MRLRPEQIRNLVKSLPHSSDASFLRDAFDLVAEAVGTERHLLLIKDHRLSIWRYFLLRRNLLRLSRGEPFAYIVQKIFFYESEFEVNRKVLIPRKETEQMVDLAVSRGMASDAEIILDIGTGSGAIAISLKKKYPEKNVLGIEKSAGALKIAKRNAARILGREDAVEWGHFDVFDLDRRRSFLAGRKCDFLISNPPYIGLRERTALDASLRYEPEGALFSGEDGLDFYRSLAVNIRDLLSLKGRYLLEMGAAQAGEVSQLFETKGERSIILDHSGHERFLLGSLFASAGTSTE
ncbi:MAG: peptide chain release factor N(5)-glutamine methyltransferase [Spirochaetia bacterium]|nr:peptide chain release factor N(5)-glutamine methyltransferase [Spirochaetia bacterium]